MVRVKNILFVFLIISVQFPVLAKEKDIDSLIALMNDKQNHDSIRLEASELLINEYAYKDPVLALKHAQLFEKIARSEKRNDWLAEVLWKQGILYRELNDVKKALGIFFDAMEMADKAKNKPLKAKINNSLGSLYYNLEKFDDAKKCFELSMKITEEIGDKYLLGDSYFNYAAIEKSLGNYQSAIEYSKKALKVNIELKDRDGQAYVYANLASIFENYNKNFDSSLYYNQKALTIFLEYNNTRSIANMYTNIGLIYIKHDKLDLALENCKKAYTLAIEAKLVNIKRGACQCLYTIYESKKDYANAFIHLKEYLQIKDSLFDEEALSENIRRETQYKYRESKVADSLQNARAKAESDLKHEQEVKEQKWFTYLGVGIAFVALGFLFFVYRGLKQKKRANSSLEEKNQLIQKQKKDVEEQKLMVEEKQKEITDSINYAKRIQYSLLAHEEMLRENLKDYFVLFQPKDIVSGDFYWCTKKDDCFYLAVCDCTGHGVPGAFMSLLNISFLNEAINEKNILEPHDVLNHVRKRLIENMEGGQDGMDGILMKFEIRNSNSLTTEGRKFEIKYAAAHNRPVLIRNGELQELPADKMPVGKGEKTDSFTLHELKLQKGDQLFFYTDGYADQFGGEKGKKFKYSNLQKFLLENRNLELQTLNLELSKAFSKWKGDLEQIDDVCVIGIRI